MQHTLLHLPDWRIALFGLAGSLLAGFAFVPTASAEAQITLSPTSHRLTIAPNETYTGSLTLINSGSDAMQVQVYPAPYHVEDEQYNPIFSKDTARTQISRWIQLEQESYQLSPDERISVPFTITTPTSIPDGGQYAAIFAETSDGESGSILRKKRVGMLIYAQAKGDTNEAGTIAMELPSPLHFTNKLTTYQRFINEGNTDITGTVSTAATSIFGKKLFSQKQQKVVLPDTTRRIPTEWKNLPSFGLVKLSQSAEFADEKATADRWVLFATPAWLLGIGALFTVIIGGIIYAIHRSKQRPRLRRR